MAVARLGYEIDSSGAVTAAGNLDKMTAASKRAETGSKRVISTSSALGRSMAANSSQVANLGAQFNDIGVQLAAGQNPFQLAIQQGTQVNQVLAQLGGGTNSLRALGAGFASIISPMSLATIGIIAGGAALVGVAREAFGASEEAKAFAESMKAVEENTRDAKLELEAFQLGLANTDQVLIQREINSLLVQREAVQKRINDANGVVGPSTRRVLATLDAQIKSLEDQLVVQNESNAALDKHNNLIESANLFLTAQQRIRRENGAEIQRRIKFEEDLTQRIGESAVEALKLAGIDINSGISQAAQSAAVLAANLGISLNAALSLQNLQGSMEYSGRGADPRQFGQGYAPPQDPVRRGRGGSRVDEFARDLENLRESLRTEREVVDEWYLEQQAILADRRSIELLGIEEHNKARLRLEQEYAERLAGVQDALEGTKLGAIGDFFGEAAGLMQSGNEKLFRIGKAAAIASAVVSGISAAIAAWEKGMQAGGIYVAAAYTAVSIAKTASQISSLRSATSSGGGGGSSGGGGGTSATAGVTAAPEQEAQQQTRAIISLQGLDGRTRFTVDEINDIIQGIQDASDDGVIIEGVTTA